MKNLIRLLFIALLAVQATAQSPATLKKELRKMESEVKQDADGLMKLAVWAEEKGLNTDRRRILQKIIKIDPEHGDAREALGFVKFDGEWLTKSKAERLMAKAKEKEMKAKGLTEVDGVWVKKDEVKDAKQGIFWHEEDGERIQIGRAEKMARSEGKIRHSVTGEFIAAADEAKADEGLFPADGEWVDQKGADRYHADPNTPWIFQSAYTTIVSNRKLDDIRDIANNIDSGIETAKPLFNMIEPTPAFRPIVMLATDAEQYKEWGNNFGAEGSAYAVFIAIDDVEIRELGTQRPTVSNYQKDWGPYWARHAGALAYASSLARQTGAELPLWFVRGVAGLAERHYVGGVAAHFGKQHLQKGGVQDLKEWFEKFEISANLTSRQLDYNVFQAGLVLSFAMAGKDTKCLEALQAVTAAFESKDAKKAAKGVADLQSALVDAEDAVRNYLAEVTRQG